MHLFFCVTGHKVLGTVMLSQAPLKEAHSIHLLSPCEWFLFILLWSTDIDILSWLICFLLRRIFGSFFTFSGWHCQYLTGANFGECADWTIIEELQKCYSCKYWIKRSVSVCQLWLFFHSAEKNINQGADVITLQRYEAHFSKMLTQKYPKTRFESHTALDAKNQTNWHLQTNDTSVFLRSSFFWTIFFFQLF